MEKDHKPFSVRVAPVAAVRFKEPAGADSPPRTSTPDPDAPSTSSTPATPGAALAKQNAKAFEVAFSHLLTYLDPDIMYKEIKDHATTPALREAFFAQMQKLVNEQVEMEIESMGAPMISKITGASIPPESIRFNPGNTFTLASKIKEICEIINTLTPDPKSLEASQKTIILLLAQGTAAIGLEDLLSDFTDIVPNGTLAEHPPTSPPRVQRPSSKTKVSAEFLTPKTKKVVEHEELVDERFSKLLKLFHTNEIFTAFIDASKADQADNAQIIKSIFATELTEGQLTARASLITLTKKLIAAETERRFGAIGTQAAEQINGYSFPEGESNSKHFTKEHYHVTLEKIHKACRIIHSLDAQNPTRSSLQAAKRDIIVPLKESMRIIGLESLLDEFNESFTSSEGSSSVLTI